MELDPCRYCNYVGDSHSCTSSHVHTHHPGKDYSNYYCLTCELMFRKKDHPEKTQYIGKASPGREKNEDSN